jgi:DNA ligase-associated metallophosphoesterase
MPSWIGSGCAEIALGAGATRLVLLPQKAAFLPAQRALLIADAHVGKAVSFRRQGVPVPRGTTSETLGVVDALVGLTGATRVVFLGDLLHSAHAHAPSTLGALARWRDRQRALELVLVRGNHDDRAGDPPPHLGFEVVDEPWPLGGLVLAHHPRPRAAGYVIAGHLHPCLGLGGRAYDHLRLPCFWFGPDVGVLPAFGGFTGMHPVRPAPGDRVFVSDGERVRALPGLHTLAA